MLLSDDITRLAPVAMRSPGMRSSIMVVRVYWNPKEADRPDTWDWISIFQDHNAEGEIEACSDHAPWGDDPRAHYPWPDKEDE